MNRFNLVYVTLFVAALGFAVPAVCQDDETATPIVLGGIPLCGDASVAKKFLAPDDPKEREKFEKEWADGEERSDGITEIRLSSPDIPLELKDRAPSRLYVFVYDGRVHGVEARWRAKGTRWAFKTLSEELVTKARAVLGEPDEIHESESTIVLSGAKEPVRTLVWHDPHRVTRVFEEKNDMKWYVAVEITCTDTLKEAVGGEGIF